MKELHVGIIGCGSITQQRHIPEYTANPQVTIHGFFDRTASRSQTMVDQYGGQVYPDIDSLLNDPAIDAVSICVSNAQHALLTIQALQAGKDVLCEKPMATTLEDCRAMVAAAKESGHRLLIDQNQRLTKAHQTARQLVANGELGQVLSFKTTFGHGGPETWSVDKGPQTWFFNKKASQYGAIFDLGIHKIDVVQYILDTNFNSAYAKLLTLDKKGPDGQPIEVDDNAMGILTTPSGIIGTLTASWTYYGEEDNSTTIYGTDGIMKIYVDPEYSITLTKRDGTKVNYQLEAIQTNDNQTASGVIDEFVDALNGQRPSILDGNRVLASMEAVFACIESSQVGHAIEF